MEMGVRFLTTSDWDCEMLFH